jgi:hypothetical protein
MLEVSMVGFDDLTEEEQQYQPDNGNGKDCSSYIKIEYKGKVIAIHSDAMEPEDCIFYRDLSWITSAITAAYDLGKLDA